MDEKKACAYALRLLARMDYPSGKLIEKMKARGASASVCETVLDKLEKRGYVNDEEYIRRFTDEKSRRGYGRRWIDSALRKKRLSPDLIRQTLSGLGEGDETAAARLALGPPGNPRLRPKKGEPSRNHAARLFAFLARRGFGAAAAQDAVRQALRVDPEE